MSSLTQILFGSGLLALSAIIHVLAVAFSLPLFKRLSERLPGKAHPIRRIIAFLLLTLAVILSAHTVEIWIWAVAFLALSDLPDLPTSFYFATVTYTTLGYGDIVLGEGARILATFCAITGLLTFGISTAFLMGVISRVLPDVVKPPEDRS